MVLSDDLIEALRAQSIGERARRVALEPGRREQAAALAASLLPPFRPRLDSCAFFASSTRLADSSMQPAINVSPGGQT